MAETSRNTREQILEATQHVLALNGFEKVTTRRIAQEAGVNIATLHYHFKTKDALLIEAVRVALMRAEKPLREAMEAAATPVHALGTAFEAMWKLIVEEPEVLRYDLVVRALRDEASRRAVRAVYDSYRNLVRETIEQCVKAGSTLAEGATPESIAYYAVASVDGILLQHQINGDRDATHASMDLVRQNTLQLVGECA